MSSPSPSPSTSASTSGRCLCGSVIFTYTGPQSWACYCHCDDCRRNCAAPVVAFIGVRLDGFRWQIETGNVQTDDAPKFYASSPGVKRYFCHNCGTPMAFQADHYDGEIHLYAPTLDNPSQFVPLFHVHYQEKLPWLHLGDDLPHYAASAPADGDARIG